MINAKKVAIYIFGLLLVALGISLHFHHGLGSNPIDYVMNVVSKKTGITVGFVNFIICMVILIVYFIRYKNKDIYISVIALFVLSLFINFFVSIIKYDNSLFIIKVIEFLIAINLSAIGVVLILKTKLSMSALECLVTLINNLKPFKKYSFGIARIIVDIILTITTIILQLIFFNKIIISSFSLTFVLICINGPMINLYLKILKNNA